MTVPVGKVYDDNGRECNPVTEKDIVAFTRELVEMDCIFRDSCVKQRKRETRSLTCTPIAASVTGSASVTVEFLKTILKTIADVDILAVDSDSIMMRVGSQPSSAGANASVTK